METSHSDGALTELAEALHSACPIVLGGDFYEASEIASFLTEFGTMDDAIVDEGHFFVAESGRGAILGSGGWSRYRPSYANGLGVGGQIADRPTSGACSWILPPRAAVSHRRSCCERSGTQ